jgi:hypothetical protein
MPDFGFIGSAYEAASPTQDTQTLINWYVELDSAKPQGERGVTALYPTPGLLSKAQLAVAEVRGLHVLPGCQYLLAVAGNTLYSITTGYVVTAVGTLATTAGRVYISDNGVAAYIVDGPQRYSYIWGTNTFSVVTDGPFDGGSTCDELDNFVVYSRPFTNQFGCTDVGDITSYALNLGSKIGGSDNIVAVFADHRQILVFGEKASERWVNVGTYPFPFAIIPGASIQHGLGAKDSVARLGEGMAFLALDDRGEATVVAWGATFAAPLRISTFAIENSIQSYAVTSDAVGYSYSQAGHEFYVLTFPTADVTWVYDLATQQWHRRAWRDTQNILHRHRSNCAAVFNGEIIVGDFENGKLYSLSQSTYTDDGVPLPAIRRGPHLTNDLKRLFFYNLQLQFQPGVGLQSGQGSDPECILRWSNDGGFTWNNDHVLKLGKAGKYRKRAIKRRLGCARDRVFEIEVTDPVYRAFVSAEMDAEGGAN